MSFASRALLAFAVMFALGGSVAIAGPLSRPTKQEARDHLDRGNRLYNTREFDEAILEFKAGALVEPVPVFDFNLGQAYRQAGKYEEAIWHYERFLTYGNPTGDVMAAVQRFVAEMKAHLADRARSMPPTEPAAASTPAPPTTSSTATAPLLSQARAEQPLPADEPSRAWTWLGWGLTAASIVGGGVTTWLAVSATGLDSDAKDMTRSTSDRIDSQNRADSRRRSAVFLGVGSGAALVLGVVTLAIPARGANHASTTAWNLGVTANGIAMFGKF